VAKTLNRRDIVSRLAEKHRRATPDCALSACRRGKNTFCDRLSIALLYLLLAWALLPTHLQAGTIALAGDCTTDDGPALQALLGMHLVVVLDKPFGGCYLVSKPLVLSPGNELRGLSANDPNPGDPASGVVILLAPRSNTPVIQTSHSSVSGRQDSQNLSITLRNIVIDGNGSNQTAELQGQALVDFRDLPPGSKIDHVFIRDALGPGLFTGSTQPTSNQMNSTELDNVWIFGCSTSTYSWIHNPGGPGGGALMVTQTFVEDQTTPAGGWHDPFGKDGAVSDPSAFAHAIWINGLQSGTLDQIHCESALTCIDLNDIQSITINGISATRLGNPSSPDPTNQYLIRALNTNVNNLTVSGIYYDQSGSTYRGDYSQTRTLGLAPGLSSNDLYETPPSKSAFPFYIHGSNTSAPYLGERSIVGNELWIQALGTYGKSLLGIWDRQQSSYAFFERDDQHLNLGFNQGAARTNEITMLQMNFSGPGDPRNNVQIPGGRIQTGTQSNTDMVGELSLTSSTAGTYSFAGYYLMHPVCNVAPRFDMGATNRMWISYQGAVSFTVNFAQAVTGTISYTCIGRQ
jgi:hypothetical protein